MSHSEEPATSCSINHFQIMAQQFSVAQSYDNTSSIQREDGKNLISLLHIKKGCKILDLGCGTGYLAKSLAVEVGPKGEVRRNKSWPYNFIKLWSKLAGCLLMVEIACSVPSSVAS